MRDSVGLRVPVSVSVFLCAALLSGLVGCTAGAPPHPPLVRSAPVDDPLVEVAASDPRIRVRTVYATPDNFVGEALYPVSRTYLRRSAMERLSAVQSSLAARGLGLIVYDGYRPWSVTKRMWDVIGDPDFVADPSKGSRHNRGMAVDCGLVDARGRELPMPTAFDAFVPEARADAQVPEPMATNRGVLVDAMAAEGFRVLSSEWWHFDLDGWEAKALLDVPIEELEELGGEGPGPGR